MSLINCPECNHEVSTTADVCPNCGHPFAPPVVHQRIVPQTTVRRETFPPWLFVPIGILGVVLLFILIFYLGSDNENASRDIDVNINARRPGADRRASDSRPNDPPNDVVIPPTSRTDTSSPPNYPQTIPPDTQTKVIEKDLPENGVVSIEAKVSDKTGKIRAVSNEKFYLLDKQLENILREAGIKSINGQNIVNTFGLSVMYPEKYSDINNKALNAIEDHVKYDALSDSGGKAQLKGVEPGSYYLFAITKTASGFAVWSSSVSIKPGENRLVLPPGRLTEISD